MWLSALIAVVAYASIFMAVIYATRHEGAMALFSLLINVGPVALILTYCALYISLHDLFVTARVLESGPVVLHYQATVLGTLSAVIYAAYDDWRYRVAQETSCENVQ